MTNFKSYSQAGQDQWVWDRIGPEGTFLDIGAGTWDFYSNTYGLERAGWKGWIIDQRPEVMERRECEVLVGDATKLDYHFIPSEVDYLSLDIDDATLECLRVLPHHRVKFKCITIEHDYYRLGGEMRDEQRKILKYHGYALLYPNVMHDGLVYEDWWTHGK